MDFWRIVGIVLLICAVSGLSVLLRELREDRKKQAEEKKKTGEKEKRPVKITTPARPASILPKSGSCGEKLTWRLKGDTLYIEGTGDMYLYRTNTWFPRDERIHRAVIAPGCTGIGNAAFEGCTGLTSVEIPNTVTVIRWSAFRGCKALKELVIPDSVREIGKDAFKDVPGIRYGGSAQSGDHRGAKQWSKQKCGGNLTWRQERGKLYIEGQGEIANNAFCSNDSIVEVVIAPGCTGIGDGAFSDCENLVSVELPEGMERIGKEAFRECTNLEDMDLPEGLQKIGESAFHKCKDLMLAIPDSVIEIGDSAFLDIPEIIYHGPCKSENNWGAVSLQTGLKGTCLCGNWRIQDKTLYLHVTGKLPWEKGEDPSWFPYVSEHNERLAKYPKSLRAEHVVIAPGCTEICSGAFMLTWIKTISIPDTVTVIGTSAFSQSDLQSVVIPDSVTAIGRNAFLGVPHIIYNGPAQSEDNWGALSRNG